MAPLIKVLEVPPIPPEGFLALPAEVRELVYAFTLVETPKLFRRHDALCDHSSMNTTSTEKPPWMSHPTDTYKGTCGKRRNMGILLANRKIHAEAAPIFWSMNQFTFMEAAQFNLDVGKSLRREYRHCLQHITIVGYRNNNVWPTLEGGIRKETWAVLERCKALRTLEIMPEIVVPASRWKSRFLDAAPHLQSVKIVRLLEERYMWRNWAWHSFWLLPGKFVPLEDIRNEEPTAPLLIDFREEFIPDVHRHMNPHVWSPWNERTPGPQLLRDGYCDTKNRIALHLFDGTTTRPYMFGLPNSPATRVRLERERRAHEAQRKEAGLLSPMEQQLLEISSTRRREKMEKARSDSDLRETAEQEARKAGQEAYRQELANADRLAVASQARARRRSMQAVAELRKIERKRGGNSN